MLLYFSTYSCWLSVDNGVIWAFVAPMIIIVIVSCFILSSRLPKRVTVCVHMRLSFVSCID